MAALALTLACGPVQYVSQVTQRASAAVQSARSAGADKYAPYEFTMAEQYLHKAREEEGYSDHQAAIRFGKKAEIYANKARRIALEHADEAEGTPPAPEGGE